MIHSNLVTNIKSRVNFLIFTLFVYLLDYRGWRRLSCNVSSLGMRSSHQVQWMKYQFKIQYWRLVYISDDVHERWTTLSTIFSDVIFKSFFSQGSIFSACVSNGSLYKRLHLQLRCYLRQHRNCEQIKSLIGFSNIFAFNSIFDGTLYCSQR